jgi:hypothetical protein
MDHLLWYFTSTARTFGLLPILRAAAICGLLYQVDLALVLARWLMGKISPEPPIQLEAHSKHSAVLVLPTLLRREDELDGLIKAVRSAATNGYPARLTVVACIDDRSNRPDLFDKLRDWMATEPVPVNVTLHAVGTAQRRGKAAAMDYGFEHVKELFAEGFLPVFPSIFFNMDADSVLGPDALERLAYKLTRKRRLARSPHLIVTSNVLVDAEECFTSIGSLFRMDRWLATLVAREYLSSISLGRSNTKIFTVNEVSGALFCTWTQVYAVAPTYARFMQSLRIVDWLKWWIGFAPPRFSEFRGLPLIEAITGPGDDTWMTWLACAGRWERGRVTFEFPRTPIHALWRLVANYVSRPLSYDPLAKVFTRTPTTCKALFNQRLRWNSSRVQDLNRWMPALVYNWQVGAHVALSTLLVVLYNALFVVSTIAPFIVAKHAKDALPLSLLAGAGYMVVRVMGSAVALVISECPARDWLKLLSLPFSGYYHIIFNTLTTIIGVVRDTLGFGEPTTFSPETTLRDSGLTRIALAYRLRRALLLACRAVVFGDVPLGWFWFGWRETPWTPSGFDGWSSGKRPPPVYWPTPQRPGSAASDTA